MVDILQPYQIAGAKFCASRRVPLLADEPGSGKTITAIKALDDLGAERILVISPAAVRRNWENELLRWQTQQRPITVVEGVPRTPPGDGVTVVSHDIIARGEAVRTLVVGPPYDVIILDESHEFRSLGSKRCANFWGTDGLWSHGKRLLCLSGTPLVNSAADFYPLFHAAWSHALPHPMDWMGFASTYSDLKSDDFGGWKAVGVTDPLGLANILRPLMLRRTLEGVGIRLPKLTVKPVRLDLPISALATAMAGLEQWSPEELERRLEAQDEVRDADLSRARHALGLAKVPAIVDHIGGALSVGNRPIVVFFQHTAVREGIQRAFSTTPLIMGTLDGKQTRKSFANALYDFQRGELDVLFVQTKCGGTGLNLVQSFHTIVAELPWTAVALAQAIKRLHRIGQTNPVRGDILLAAGCWIEDVLFGVVMRKHHEQRQLLELLAQ